jgi:hypothetical protein
MAPCIIDFTGADALLGPVGGGGPGHTWALKGTASRDFLLLVLFMNQFPPSPRVFHYDRFEFFRKFAKIFAAQGLPPVSLTPVANGKKSSIRKILIILFGHLWAVEETYI